MFLDKRGVVDDVCCWDITMLSYDFFCWGWWCWWWVLWLGEGGPTRSRSRFGSRVVELVLG